LEYIWIDEFIKLVIVLMKTTDFNKHEFMNKVFDSVHEQLEEDYQATRGEFSQKPYYRVLLNVLTRTNNSDCFNAKTHGLVLFSLADLFNKLNPNKYPGFAFAWLELISHKDFIPYFLKTPAPTSSVI